MSAPMESNTLQPASSTPPRRSLSSSPSRLRRKMAMPELTFLSSVWHPRDEPPLYSLWMASSEVDQKFLGHFAKVTSAENNYLSSFLYRVLGLSVILAEKLLRARRARQLDPVRDPKARHLIHHILWLAREGLVMVEQYIVPMVRPYVELKVLSYKLRASFYHIFVLFHNDPAVNDRVVRSRSASHGSLGGTYGLFPDPLDPRSARSKGSYLDPVRSPSGRRRHTESLGGTGVRGQYAAARTPPGLPIPDPYSTSAGRYMNGSSKAAYAQDFYSNYQPSRDSSLATYFMAYRDYTTHATAAFKDAATLADSLLPGSHPIRLSVKVEYVAYVYDCLKEAEVSRRMARQAIRHVYEAREGMDDESFEDAAEMVGILGRMMQRGLTPGSASGSQEASSSAKGGVKGENAKGHRRDATKARASTKGEAVGRGGGGDSRRKSSGNDMSSRRSSTSVSASASGSGGATGRTPMRAQNDIAADAARTRREHRRTREAEAAAAAAAAAASNRSSHSGSSGSRRRRGSSMQQPTTWV